MYTERRLWRHYKVYKTGVKNYKINIPTTMCFKFQYTPRQHPFNSENFAFHCREYETFDYNEMFRKFLVIENLAWDVQMMMLWYIRRIPSPSVIIISLIIYHYIIHNLSLSYSSLFILFFSCQSKIITLSEWCRVTQRCWTLLEY